MNSEQLQAPEKEKKDRIKELYERFRNEQQNDLLKRYDRIPKKNEGGKIIAMTDDSGCLMGFIKEIINNKVILIDRTALLRTGNQWRCDSSKNFRFLIDLNSIKDFTSDELRTLEQFFRDFRKEKKEFKNDKIAHEAIKSALNDDEHNFYS